MYGNEVNSGLGFTFLVVIISGLMLALFFNGLINGTIDLGSINQFITFATSVMG